MKDYSVIVSCRYESDNGPQKFKRNSQTLHGEREEVAGCFWCFLVRVREVKSRRHDGYSTHLRP